MDDLAQRIIASHKAAGKRAAQHLERTRNLNLSVTQSLELVASVLGVANWQTLLALAHQGRGPRIDDLLTVPAPVYEPTVADKLAAYFRNPGQHTLSEHPSHTRNHYWDFQCANLATKLGYWEFVAFRIQERQEMLPWDRDTNFATNLGRMARLDVEWDDESWNILDPWAMGFTTSAVSEKEAWNMAADAVQGLIGRRASLSHRKMAAMTEQDWLEAAAATFNVRR